MNLDPAAHVLDADWRSDAVFATCSADKTIQVCRVGDEVPVMSFEGHAKEINSIKWDPQGIMQHSIQHMPALLQILFCNRRVPLQMALQKRFLVTLRWMLAAHSHNQAP